jgi:outer membrane protein assembly factor BamB
VVWNDRVFLTTAIGSSGTAEIRTGLDSDFAPVQDGSVHTWQVICLDRKTGDIMWQRIAECGVPQFKRHPKSTHANSTPATDGNHVVAFFASEGLYCYDFDGNLLWKKMLGDLNSGWFYDADFQWGFGSSPIIYDGMVIVQCDVQVGSFVAAFDVATGEERWKTARDEIPTWGSPTVYEGPHGP